MINNTIENTESTPESVPNDVAVMDIQSHLLITDADTNEILVNQRG